MPAHAPMTQVCLCMSQYEYHHMIDTIIHRAAPRRWLRCARADRCVFQQLRYGVVCTEQASVWAWRCLFRYNCIGLSVSHTAQLSLRASTLLQHSEGAVQCLTEHPSALDSSTACTLHLIDNVVYLRPDAEDGDNDKLFRCPEMLPRNNNIIDRNNLLVLHEAPRALQLPDRECPEVFAADGSLVDPDEFAFEIDPATGEPGQSKTLPPGWRTEWIATRRFGGDACGEEEAEGAQQICLVHTTTGAQLSHPLVEMGESGGGPRERCGGAVSGPGAGAEAEGVDGSAGARAASRTTAGDGNAGDTAADPERGKRSCRSRKRGRKGGGGGGRGACGWVSKRRLCSKAL